MTKNGQSINFLYQRNKVKIKPKNKTILPKVYPKFRLLSKKSDTSVPKVVVAIITNQ